MHSTVSAKDVLDKIAVQRPYFALEELSISDNTVRAKIPAQQKPIFELDLITAAEIGRHLAILGSVALSTQNSSSNKHVYLAEAAALLRVSDIPIDTTDLYAESTHTEFSTRQGSSESKLFASGIHIYTLAVQYNIIPLSTFKRVFRKHLKDASVPPSNNPYKQTIPLGNTFYTKTSAVSEITYVFQDYCLGHFVGIPVLPISILMFNLSHTAGLLLHHLTGTKTQYTVEKADIKAESLIFSDSKVRLEAHFINQQETLFIFKCQAISEGAVCGEMLLSLKPY